MIRGANRRWRTVIHGHLLTKPPSGVRKWQPSVLTIGLRATGPIGAAEISNPAVQQ
jgi:hypothetical protein